MITDLKSIDQYKPIVQELLGNIEFNEGKRYSDFNAATDKVAEYGLAALVGGIAAKNWDYWPWPAHYWLNSAN